MFGRNLLFFCLLSTFLAGFAQARKFDINKLNVTAFHKPQISSAAARPFWDPDFCDDWQDLDAFPHPDSCQEFLICWQGELWEMICDDGDLFDPWDAVCDSADQVVCLDDWPPEGNWPEDDDECPPAGSNEVRFLPSIYCDEYYICINGQPVLLQCRPGMHWNVEEEFCDDPTRAGCDPDAEINHPDQLPDCPINFVGQLPHPHNCNWFIHCDRGSRSIQQCQHLHHFDPFVGRCLVKTIAQCMRYSRNHR